MFTGIVEHLGTVSSVESAERGRTIVVEAGPVAESVAIGDSMSVNGVCLTAVRVDGPAISFQAVGETLDRTNLGSVEAGQPVNLERPMAASGRFDGHIVQGHVDGVGTVLDVETDGEEARRLRIEVPPALQRYIVEKGSITIDGVSLTVAAVDEAGVEVALIPHTLQVTTFGTRRPGDRVNLEVDVLAKYVERLLGASL
jgi:riboflavin synthase